jgi:hypothetical protein
MQVSVGKVMLMLFWDHQGPLVEQYMSKGTTVTSALYCNLRNHPIPAIRLRCCGLLCTGVLLPHDNASPRTSHVTGEMIRDILFECPSLPYSPEFTSCDYHILAHSTGPLMERLSDPMKKCKRQCISGYTCSQRIFFSWGIQALVKHQRTCVQHNWGYVEKWQSCSEPICTKLAGIKNVRVFIWLTHLPNKHCTV